MKIPIEISARHIHLSRKDCDSLFGANYELNIDRPLSQRGEFASQESISLLNGDNHIDNVRVVGPLRKQTQVEISLTDAHKLLLAAPIRLSGDLVGSGSITIKTPKNKVDLAEGVIVARRHLHCSPDEAKKLNLANNQIISIQTTGVRSVIFKNIIVRVADNFRLSFQLDTDEANAAGVKNGDFGEII